MGKTKICTDCGHRKGLHKSYVVQGKVYYQCLGDPPAKYGYLSKCDCCNEGEPSTKEA